MNWRHSSSIQLVISDLNEIAADLYRHRIRPASRRGGNGAFDASRGGLSYTLPSRLSSNVRATFEILNLSADRVSLRALSPRDPSTFITATIDSRGRLVNILLPGQPKGSAEVQKPAEGISSGGPKPRTVFLDDMP